jgi:hypothetical protein
MGRGEMERVPAGNSRRVSVGAILWSVVVILFGAGSIGSQCNPIIAALENECGCTGNQESICGECVTPLGAGAGDCTDECGKRPCSVGLLCFNGQCSPFPPQANHGVGLAARCEAAAEQAPGTNSCGTGLYCRSRNCPFGNGFNDGYDHCSAYALQGETCGSTDSNGLPCGECEPGAQCVNGVCAVSCGGPGSGPGPGGDCAQMCGGAFPHCIATGSFEGDIESTDVYGGSCYLTCGNGVGAACSPASPCCDLGNACGNGRCCETPDSYTLSQLQCRSNSDCCNPAPGNPNGQVCAPNGNGANTCQGCFGIGSGKPCSSVAECCGGGSSRCGPTAAGGASVCLACVAEGQKCFPGTNGSDECCSGLTCQNGLCVTSPGGKCSVDADCPSNAPKCLCGECVDATQYALGDSCNPNADKNASCLCGQVTSGATCAAAANSAEDRCCLAPLQHCTNVLDCCNPPPCNCNGGGGGSGIVCSAPQPGQKQGVCCIPIGSGASGPRCSLTNDICCPGSKCTQTTFNGQTYTYCAPSGG